MNIAINGLGRIGKSILRALYSRKDKHPQLVPLAINIGPASLDQLVQSIRYDSIMGPLQESMLKITGNILSFGSWNIQIFQESAPEKLPWKALAIDCVIECSGIFTKREEAMRHQKAGAKKVIISAPAKNPDCTIIPGVNNHMYNPNQTIISSGSCTTNAIAPLIKVIQSLTPITSIQLVTTHAYTNSQHLVDTIPSQDATDIRQFRAAGINIIPGSTGAGKLMSEIFPELKDKTSAIAIRVPVANVSLVQVFWVGEQPIEKNTINQTFSHAEQSSLHGILATTNDPVVSSDFIGNPYSVTLDAPLTEAVGNHGRILGWYDNEWGYSNRIIDFLQSIA